MNLNDSIANGLPSLGTGKKPRPPAVRPSVGDLVDMLPLSDRIREPLRRALAGEAAAWPQPLTGDEAGALIQHGVAPLVYATAHLPELRDEAIRAAAIEPLRLADLRAVLAALAGRGVTPLLMKGTPLAYALYRAPELRPRGDNDLLVPHSALETVRATLLDLGFEERLTSGDEHGVRQVTFLRADALGAQHVYDVHWKITNSPLFAETLRYDELRARAVAAPHISEHALALSRVDALLHACIHRVAHHHDTDRLIWLCDIELLRARMSPEEHQRFWRLAAERGVVGVCIRAIELTDDWYARPPYHRAEEWLMREEIERDEPSRAFLDRQITRGGIMVANLRALPWPDRLRRLWQLALPPASFMRQSFPERGRLALPWLYVYRAARGVTRLFRRVGA